MSDTILSLNAKLNVNFATYDSPDWRVVEDAGDVSLPLTKGEFNVGRRGNAGWDAVVGVNKNGGITFTLIVRDDTTSQAMFAKFLDSFMNNTALDVAAMSGPIGESGSQGLRARMECFDLSRGEPLAGALTHNIVLKVTDDDNPPEWLTIA